MMNFNVLRSISLSETLFWTGSNTSHLKAVFNSSSQKTGTIIEVLKEF